MDIRIPEGNISFYERKPSAAASFMISVCITSPYEVFVTFFRFLSFLSQCLGPEDDTLKMFNHFRERKAYLIV